MSTRRRVARAAALGACAALLIVSWYFFAPRQLGGRASYVTTTGTSMEPLLHGGDLAVVYPSSEYVVGDVVAYRNPDIHHVVLHRIVALDGDRFVVKGDNNSWMDDYHPAASEIFGSMAFHVPDLGMRLGAVRTPWGIGAIVSLAGLAVFGGRRRMRRGSRRAAAAREEAPALQAGNGHGPGPAPTAHRMIVPAGLVPAFAGVAILSLALSGLLFALSPTVTTKHDVTYDQQGTFSYTGLVASEGHDAYGAGAVQTGDPAYLHLTSRLQVAFDYAIDSSATVDASGTVRMVAELSDVNGWTRTIELAPATAFQGAGVHVEGQLDLQALLAMTAKLEHLTGVERDHYTVAVRPDVRVEGTLAGRPLAETFAPELRFLLDPLQLQLEPTSVSSTGEAAADPIHPDTAGLVKTQTEEPRTFSILGRDLGMDPLRVGSLAVFGVAALGWLAIVLRRLLSARRGEAAAIETRYGQFLVPVHAGALAPSDRSVQVDSFDALLRLANHYGHVVLHEEGAGFHAYTVEEDGVTYRYLVSNGVHS